MSIENLINIFNTEQADALNLESLASATAANHVALVDAAYENLLGLSGDFDNATARKAYWLGRLDSGDLSEEGLAAEFLDLAANVQGNLTEAQFAANQVVVPAVSSAAAEEGATLATIATAAKTAANEAAIEGTSLGLTETLVALQDAQVAEAEALAAIAQAENASLEEPLEGDDLEAYVEAYTATDAEADFAEAETAVGDAEVALLNAESSLRAARNDIGDANTVTNGDYLNGDRLTDANLTAALNDVRDDIQADDTARPLLNDRTEAQSELDSDVSEDGSNRQMITDLRTAIVAYANEGGDLTATFTATLLDGTDGTEVTVTVSEFLGVINTVLDPEDDAVPGGVDKLVAAIGNEGYELAGATDEADAIDEAIVAVEERDALIDAVTAAQNALEGNPLGQDLSDIEALIEAREGLVEDVTEAQAAEAEAEEFLAQMTELVAAYEAAGDDTTAAQEALEELGVENLVELEATSTAGASGESDLYLFSAENTADVSLLNFEEADQLFLGEGFSRVDLEADADLSAERLGDSSELEVFFQQDGTNTVISVETESFGGSATDLNDVTQITLTGVSVDDLQFENGYVTVVEAA